MRRPAEERLVVAPMQGARAWRTSFEEFSAQVLRYQTRLRRRNWGRGSCVVPVHERADNGDEDDEFLPSVGAGGVTNRTICECRRKLERGGVSVYMRRSCARAERSLEDGIGEDTGRLGTVREGDLLEGDAILESVEVQNV